MQISMMSNESLITVYTIICRIKLLRYLSDAKHREQVFCDDPANFCCCFCGGKIEPQHPSGTIRTVEW